VSHGVSFGSKLFAKAIIISSVVRLSVKIPGSYHGPVIVTLKYQVRKWVQNTDQSNFCCLKNRALDEHA